GQVRYPKPICAAHFDGNAQYFIERNEERYLKEKRHTTGAERIDAVLLIEIHDLLVLFSRPWVADAHILVLFVNGIDLRLKRRHLAHSLHPCELQGEEKEVDDDGQDDDRPSIVVNVVVVYPVECLE